MIKFVPAETWPFSDTIISEWSWNILGHHAESHGKVSSSLSSQGRALSSLPGVAAIGGEKRDAQLIPTSRVMRKALVTKREGRGVDRGGSGRAPISSLPTVELWHQGVGKNIEPEMDPHSQVEGLVHHHHHQQHCPSLVHH